MEPARIEEHKSPREKLLGLEAEISSRVFEREEEIRGFSVGLLTRAHVLFLGPKGCAKSTLGRLLADAVAWEGVPEGQDPYFRTQLGRDSVLDELFGPVSGEGFENDSFRRVIAHMLPTAKLGLIEEIYKANSTILNRLLTLLNEGLFKNGTEPERQVPLNLVVGTSNELPDDRDDNLDAFHDRFLLRYEVRYLQDPQNVRTMMERANSGEQNEPIPTMITEAEITEGREEAARVDVSPVFDAIDDILLSVADREIEPSDRRRAALVSLVKAQAYLSGRSQALRADLGILAHALWEETRQIPDVARIVLAAANPHAFRAHNLFDTVNDSYEAAMKAHRERKENNDEEHRKAETDAGIDANVALLNVKRQLFELREAAKDAGADPKRIDDLLSRTVAMNEEVEKKCLPL